MRLRRLAPDTPSAPSLPRSRLVSQESGEVVEFFRSLAVGRDPRNDLVLADAEISGRHAVMDWRDGGWRVRDLGSRNGTTLNGRRLHGWKAVGEGDTVRFAGVASWKVERLVEPIDVAAATAFVEDLSSGAWSAVCADRYLVGTGSDCDLAVPEWLPDAGPAIRLVIYEENGLLWLAATQDVAGMTLEGDPFPVQPVLLDQARRVGLGERQLVLFPAGETDLVPPTASAMRRTKQYDLRMRLRFVGPGDGVIEVDHPGGTVTLHGAQRFVLLYLLAKQPGEWIGDDELRAGLWGRVGAGSRDPSALGKIIYDTRQVFTSNGLDGWFIEKARGRTRIRIAPDRVEIHEE